MSDKQITWSDVFTTLTPIALVGLMGLTTFLVSETYALKYSALTSEDATRITVAGRDYTDDHFQPLMDEVLRLRATVEKQSITLAETLAEVRIVREQLAKQKKSEDSG